ncbi:MAG: ATP-binding cassette domain-containing protein [Salinisphaera sp.]|jgi:branched-chain amino acid transport system ATP-binding protein|nr:ATP-binding cassette domain-containing protein [Salinisphaera sp.]
MSALLEVQGLGKHFGGVRAVHDMAFEVGAGEILGLIGPNGSGKSTTLSLLMGVTRADRGSIRCLGRDISRWPIHRIANHGVAMVFQHSRPLKRQTTLENIKLALLKDSILDVFPKPALDQRARALAAKVGLTDVIDEPAERLAFAHLRRMEFAKALALEPQVLLLDEPFAGLAPAEVREFIGFTESLRDQGLAIILVDHNVKAVSGLVDRIVAMYLGEKIAEGVPQEVIGNARVREVFLGSSADHAEPSSADRSARTELKSGLQSDPAENKVLEIKIEALRYGKAQALEQVHLDIAAGEFVSVVGLNGAGKTSLFNAISGFTSYDGDIHWLGNSLRGRSPARISRDGIAHCPENRELFTYMSVQENLQLGGYRRSADERASSLEQLFDLFPRLAERRRQSAHTLSGGEQQMLTIARALMQRPQLLILDEPTLGLAPLIMDAISETLEKLRRELGLTILLGEQNVHFALRHSDHMLLLENGTLRWQGNVQAFHDEIGDSYL